MSSLSRATQLKPKADVQFRPVEGGGMLVDVVTGGCFRVNEVGAEAWTCVAGGLSVGGAVDSLGQRYEVRPDRLESDLFRLFNELLNAGLVTLSEPGTAAPR